LTFVTPRTWVAADVPTAAQFNADMRDNLNYLIGARGGGFNDIDQPWFFGRDNSLGPIAHAAVAVASFDTIQHSASASPFSGTALLLPDSGVYFVQASTQFDTNGVVAVRILRNGANVEFGNCAWYGNNVNWHVNPGSTRLVRETAASGTISVTVTNRTNNAAANASFVNCHGQRMGAA
jgi:hypothetical protein